MSKKTIVVQLQVQELLYDIINKTTLAGESRQAGGKNYESTSHLQASMDDEDLYQLHRSINNAYVDLKREFAEYLELDGIGTSNLIKDNIDDNGVIVLRFKLPSNFNQSAYDALGTTLHEYIVNKSIYDWYTLTNKEESADYSVMADGALQRAMNVVFKRKRPSRPSQEPTPLS